MTRRCIAGLVLLLAASAQAQNPPLRVAASNGVKAVIEELVPKAESTIGRRLVVEYNTTTALKQKIDAGEVFDVAILTTDGLDDLIKAGKITAATRAEFARSGIG